MNETKEKRNTGLREWWRLCPVRHVLTFIGFAVIGAYFALRGNAALMGWLSRSVTRPWHRFMSRLCGHFAFSVAECLIVLGVLAALVYIIISIVQLIRRPEKLKRAYRVLLTALTCFALIYGGFCLLWGVYYYTSDFEAQSGIYGAPMTLEQLETVTRYFTDLVNDYGEQVERDEDGCFAGDTKVIFDHSARLYDEAAARFPCLAGDALRAKPFFLSRFMS